MSFLSQIVAEERIRQDMEKGGFDNLEGMGKPLKPDEAQHLPPELRLAYRMLKSGGFVPPALAEEQEINRTIDLLAGMEDEGERYRQMHKLHVMIMKMNEGRGRAVNLEASDDYYRRIVEKVRIAEDRFKKDV
ncbi:DnaJ family domain-containing protein [Pseudodesulfovibrio piezophilus]|nr:DnaJ family domain-containing protein [Pseudodesulfovibrio piezophilus]